MATKPQLLILLGILNSGTLFAECLISEQLKASTTNQITIEATQNYQSAVIPKENGMKSCFVSYEVKYKEVWYPVYGEHQWDGHIPVNTICDIARQHALNSFISSHAEKVISLDQELTCKEGRTKLLLSEIGQSVDITKATMDAMHPKPFYYMGTTCYWINDVEWRKQKLNSFNGIACQIKEHEWILVDKF
jgi:hypothetical protein